MAGAAVLIVSGSVVQGALHDVTGSWEERAGLLSAQSGEHKAEVSVSS
jgi:hypothetical protein